MLVDRNMTLYDSSFYDAQAEESMQSARNVLPILFRTYNPKSVIDVGCGVGTWLRVALDLGVPEGLGIDGGYVQRDQLVIPSDLFMTADLSQPGWNDVVPARLHPRFDLVMCLEVAEHLPFERSASFVDDLCQLGDVVLFSAAIPFQHGTGHVNEQWAEFWALHFRSHKFRCFDILRDEIWSLTGVDWWYAQNILVFVKEDTSAFHSFPSERMDGPMSRVHPMAWLSSILYHWHPNRVMARGSEEIDYKAVVQGWIRGDCVTPQLQTVEQARAAGTDNTRTFPHTRMIAGDPDLDIQTLKIEHARQDFLKKAELDQIIKEKINIEIAFEAETVARLTELHTAQCLQRKIDIVAAANTILRLHVTRYMTELAQVPFLSAQLEQSHEQTRVKEMDIDFLESKINSICCTMKQIIVDRDNLRIQVIDRDLLQSQLTELLSSTSWYVTAPLRAIRRILNRIILRSKKWR